MNEVFLVPLMSAATPQPSPGPLTRELPTSVPAHARLHRPAHEPDIRVDAIVRTALHDPEGPARQNQFLISSVLQPALQRGTSCTRHFLHSHDSVGIPVPLKLEATIDLGSPHRFFHQDEEM